MIYPLSPVLMKTCILELLTFLAARPVVVVSFVDERVLFVRDAWDISARFAVVEVAGPVAPPAAHANEDRADYRRRGDQARI